MGKIDGGFCTNLWTDNPLLYNSPHLILSTAGFPEICHRRELGVDGKAIKPAVIQFSHCLLRIFLILELQHNAQLDPGDFLFEGRNLRKLR